MTAQIIPFPTNRKTVEQIVSVDPFKATCEQVDEAMRELERVNESASSAMKYALNMVGRMPPCA